MSNIPGITKIEFVSLDGTKIDMNKLGEAKFTLKSSKVGLQEVFDSQLEFFTFGKINLLQSYQVVITTVSGAIYILGKDSDPLPTITAEFRDGITSDYKGWEYKAKHRGVVTPLS